MTRIVLACYWEMRTSASPKFRQFDFRDDGYDGSGPAYKRVSLENGFDRLLAAYPNHSFAILEDVPTGSEFDPSAAARLAHVRGVESIGARMGISRQAYEAQLAVSRPIFERLARSPAVRVFPVIDHLCDQTFCSGWREGRALYRDDDHISETGALLLSEVFRGAVQQPVLARGRVDEKTGR